MGAEAHAEVGPGVEVRLHVNGATGALVVTNRPVLLESARALNRRLVVALSLQDTVGAAVDIDGTLLLRGRRRVVRAEVLDNVVPGQILSISSPTLGPGAGAFEPSRKHGLHLLDERVTRPAVHGQVAVTVGPVGTAVVDGAGRRMARQLICYNGR